MRSPCFLSAVVLFLLGWTQALTADPSSEDQRLSFWMPKLDQASVAKPFVKLSQWLDRGHASISDQIRLSAQGFDGLFGKTHEDDPNNKSHILTRTGLLFEEGDSPSPLFRFSAKIDLPRLKKRWKLLVHSTTESFFDKRISGTGDPFRSGEGSKTENQILTSALRWSLIQDVRQVLNLDLGVKVKLSPQAYLKSNYLKRWELGHRFGMVFNQHVFGVINGDSGSTTSLDFDRPIEEHLLYRIHHRYTRIFEETFATWQVSHSLYQILSKRATLAYHASVTGDDRNHWQHQDVALAVHYKRNYFRPWIWLFAEPELHHPRSRDWKRTHQLTVGLEALFGGT